MSYWRDWLWWHRGWLSAWALMIGLVLVLTVIRAVNETLYWIAMATLASWLFVRMAKKR